MSKWRELKYYDHGTPTKASLKDRRRHLFMHYVDYDHDHLGDHHSPCGLHVFAHRFSEGPTTVRKCGHCIKAQKPEPHTATGKRNWFEQQDRDQAFIDSHFNQDYPHK